jgi:hypothetical protein
MNMEKSHGATLGTVVLAALLLRPGTTGTPELKPEVNPASTAAGLQGKAITGDGPWVASCEFWAPEWRAPTPSTNTFPTSFSLQSEDARGNLSLQGKVSQERDCDGETGKWGIPKAVEFPEPDTTPKITVIIATVPDPIRTNLALQFDWTIDAMLG